MNPSNQEQSYSSQIVSPTSNTFQNDVSSCSSTFKSSNSTEFSLYYSERDKEPTKKENSRRSTIKSKEKIMMQKMTSIQMIFKESKGLKI